MGLYLGWLIIVRIFASEIWGAYFREGLFLGGLGLIIGILRYVHSDLELGTVLRRIYLLLIFFLCEVRFDYRREFKEVLKFQQSKRNTVRIWSEIGCGILG